MLASSSNDTPYHRLETPALVAHVLAALLIITTLGVTFWDLQLLGAFSVTGPTPSLAAYPSIAGYLSTLGTLAVTNLTLALLLAVALLRWLQVGYENLQRFDPTARSLHPHALSGFFIPVFNLWHMLQMLDIIERHSQPKRVTGSTGPGQGSVLRLWWWSMVVALGLGWLGRYAAPPQEASAVVWHLCGSLAGAATCTLLILMVRSISRLQAARCGHVIHWLGMQPTHLPPAPAYVPRLAAPASTPTSQAAFELLAIAGADTGAVFPLESAQTILGRKEPGAPHIPGTIGVEESSVSRVHALVEYNPTIGGYAITHRSTTNLTVLNEIPLSTHPMPMRPGDRIRMGRLELVFRQRESAPVAPALAAAPWGGAPPPLQRPRLELERVGGVSPEATGVPEASPLPASEVPPVSATVRFGPPAIPTPPAASASGGDTLPPPSPPAAPTPPSTAEVAPEPAVAAEGAAAEPPATQEKASAKASSKQLGAPTAPPFGRNRGKARSAEPEPPSPIGKKDPISTVKPALATAEQLSEVATAQKLAASLRLHLQTPVGERSLELVRTAYSLGGLPDRGGSDENHLLLEDPAIPTELGILLFDRQAHQLELHLMHEANASAQVKRPSGRGHRTQLVGPGEAYVLRADDRILVGGCELTLEALQAP